MSMARALNFSLTWVAWATAFLHSTMRSALAVRKRAPRAAGMRAHWAHRMALTLVLALGSLGTPRLGASSATSVREALVVG